MQISGTDVRTRAAEAGIGAGVAAGVMATPIMASAMFGAERYGESPLRAMARGMVTPALVFGAPVVAGAAASRFVDGGPLASALSGGAAAAAVGAALGATVLHGTLQAGMPPLTRAATAGLMAIAGGVFGALSGTVAHALDAD